MDRLGELEVMTLPIFYIVDKLLTVIRVAQDMTAYRSKRRRSAKSDSEVSHVRCDTASPVPPIQRRTGRAGWAQEAVAG